MRLFPDLAESVFERSDDSSGSLGTVFQDARADLGRIWPALPDRDPRALAREVLAFWDRDEPSSNACCRIGSMHTRP